MKDLDLMICAHMCELDEIVNQMEECAQIGIMNVNIDFPFVPTQSDWNYLKKQLNKRGIDI